MSAQLSLDLGGSWSMREDVDEVESPHGTQLVSVCCSQLDVNPNDGIITDIIGFLEQPTPPAFDQSNLEAIQALGRHEAKRVAYLEAKRRYQSYGGKSQRELSCRIQKLRTAWSDFLECDHLCKLRGHLPFRSDYERRCVLLNYRIRDYDPNIIGPSLDGVDYRRYSKAVVCGPRTIGGPDTSIIRINYFVAMD